MTSEQSVPKIQVGRDFRIGDVPGQVAAGDGITQTQYTNCTFNYPDGSTVHGRSWLYTQGRPAIDPDNIFGRQQELDEIDRRFERFTALAITGFRGTGKSTLASMYLDRIEKRGGYAGIYWRKVDATTDITDVVDSFFTVIGKPIQEIGRYKSVDLLNLLFRELNAAPYFLVFDNFEVLLDPQTNMPLKKKAGFSDLIENAGENAGKSRILFTSWECPVSERGITPEFYCIGGLDEKAALQLLRRKGLTEPEDDLKKAATLAGGHPLALILLTQLVKGGKKLSSILKDNALWIGEKGRVAVNILDKVYRERLNDEERRLLQYVSLYRKPVPSEAIVAAAPDLTRDVVESTALNLIMKSLLQVTEENYWEESLVQSYAHNKLADRVERHKLACKYYLEIPLPEKEKRTKKEDVQPLIEAHYHACMAGEYDRAASIIFDYKLDDDLDRWGHYRTLVELYTGLLPKDPFEDKPLLNNIKIHSWVLGSLGLAYHTLGEVSKAIEYHEKAFVIAQKIGDKSGEGVWLGNLGIAYHDLGEVNKAIEYHEKALNIAQEIGDKRKEGTWLNNLGFIFQNEKKYREALAYYLLAKDIRTRIEDLNLATTESNLKALEEQLGEKEFEKLKAEVAPRAEEIVREMLEETSEKSSE